MLMCFYLLPFPAFSRREMAQLPGPLCPSRFGCPERTLCSRAALRWWGRLDRLARMAFPGKGYGTCSSSCELSVKDAGPLVCSLLEVLTGPVLWGSPCCLFSAADSARIPDPKLLQV